VVVLHIQFLAMICIDNPSTNPLLYITQSLKDTIESQFLLNIHTMN